MSRLSEIYKQQRMQGKGLGSTLSERAKEKYDPRKFLDQRGLLVTMMPFLKAYRSDAKRAYERTAPTTTKSSSVADANIVQTFKVIQANSILTAKNTSLLPKMAKDMNVVSQNISKLVKLTGETPSTRASKYFASAKAREDEYEARFKKDKEKAGEVKKEEKKGFLSSLLEFFKGGFGNIISGLVTGLIKGGLLVGLLVGIGKYFRDPEFRKTVNETISTIMETVFGGDWAKNLITGIGALALGFVALKTSVLLLSKFIYAVVAKMAANLGIPGFDVPDIPDKPKSGKGAPKGRPGAKGRPGSKVPRFGASKGILGLLGLGAAAGGAYALSGSDDKNVDVDPSGNASTVSNQEKESTSWTNVALNAAGAGFAGYQMVGETKKIMNRSNVKGYNEKAGRFTGINQKTGKTGFISAKEIPKGEMLQKFIDFAKKAAQKKWMPRIIGKLGVRLGTAISTKAAVFLVGLTAPGIGWLASLISLATLAFDAFIIYEAIFGQDGILEELEKEDTTNAKQPGTPKEDIKTPQRSEELKQVEQETNSMVSAIKQMPKDVLGENSPASRILENFQKDASGAATTPATGTPSSGAQQTQSRGASGSRGTPQTASSATVSSMPNKPSTTSPGAKPGSDVMVQTYEKNKPISRIAGQKVELPVEKGILTSKYGIRRDPHDRSKEQNHHGIDISVPEGTPVTSPEDDLVVSYVSGWSDPSKPRSAGPYYVELSDKNGLRHRLLHLKQPSVQVGQKLKKGDVVGLSGSAGTGPHLHWETYNGNRSSRIDPLQTLGQTTNVADASKEPSLEEPKSTGIPKAESKEGTATSGPSGTPASTAGATKSAGTSPSATPTAGAATSDTKPTATSSMGSIPSTSPSKQSGTAGGISDKFDYEKYKSWVGHFESGGKYNTPPNKLGYFGKYGMGAQLLETAGYLKPGYSKDPTATMNPDAWANGWSLEKMLNTPEGHQAQESIMDFATKFNMNALQKNGVIKENTSGAELASVLYAAHHGGTGGASKWFLEGRDTKDALFGDKATVAKSANKMLNSYGGTPPGGSSAGGIYGAGAEKSNTEAKKVEGEANKPNLTPAQEAQAAREAAGSKSFGRGAKALSEKKAAAGAAGATAGSAAGAASKSSPTPETQEGADTTQGAFGQYTSLIAGLGEDILGKDSPASKILAKFKQDIGGQKGMNDFMQAAKKAGSDTAALLGSSGGPVGATLETVSQENNNQKLAMAGREPTVNMTPAPTTTITPKQPSNVPMAPASVTDPNMLQHVLYISKGVPYVGVH
jgi:murein DD-endopeptidase MepM/ murein hydrolase activator NlpD